jgi:hypothetical protein
MSQQPLAEQGHPVPAPPVRRRRWWVSLLLTLVVFVSGFAAGGGTVVIFARKLLDAVHRPDRSATQIATRVSRQLKLSDQQTTQVEDILRTRLDAIRAAHSRWLAQLVKELDRIETEVAATLNDEQRERWHAGFAKQRRLWLPPMLEDQAAKDRTAKEK